NLTRDACYTRDGRAEDGAQVAYIEYDVNSDCAQLPMDTLDAYPCGSDHTPSPMASRVPLEATPVLEWPGVQLTAVAVTMEDGHTIAFLGDSQGQLHRVYLGPGSDGHPYSTQSIQPGSAVSRDLTFDGAFEHLYVMTQSTLLRVPVAACAQHLDCASCLAHRDPYCGWCVLLGRPWLVWFSGGLARAHPAQCPGSAEETAQVSPGLKVSLPVNFPRFGPEPGCLQVAAMRPANISREERREVFLTVPDLPPLWPGESYSCHFGEYQSPALPTASGVRCLSPDPSGAPVLPRGADHVSVSVELRLGAVVIAKAPLSFYDCVAITDLHPSAPLARFLQEEGSWGASACPCVESVQGSTLLPVHVERKVRLLGRNLRLLQDGPGDSECVMELEGREVAVAAEVECELPPDTRCHVTCQQHQVQTSVPGWAEVPWLPASAGAHTSPAPALPCDPRESWDPLSDTPFCVSGAPGSQLCLWSCVPRGLGSSDLPLAPPSPLVSWAPGPRALCLPWAPRLPVSALTACRSVPFPQDPKVHSLFPSRGPRAGGTRLTLRGAKLLTGRPEDIRVMVGDQPCHLLVCVTEASGEEVTGAVTVEVPGRGRGVSEHDFAYQVRMGNLRFSLGPVQYDGESPAAFPLAAQVGLGVGTSLLALGVSIIVLMYRWVPPGWLRRAGANSPPAPPQDAVGEPLYMLFRGIKHQVDKGPVDSVTGKAKYTLNDNRLLREDVEYRPLTLNALLAVGPGAGETQGVPVKVLDCDTISQAKEKMLDQLCKGLPLAQRPDSRTLDVEWRSGVAGHLILSDEDVTSEVQGLWRRLNTLQHYKVPDGATVALVPCLTKHALRENQDYVPGERTPMLEDVDEGGVRPWHLVKPSSLGGGGASFLKDEQEQDKQLIHGTLNALLAVGPGAGETQGVPVKVLDCDTISQAKEKMLDQLCKGLPLAQRPDSRTLDVEWRSGVAGHLILSDEDVTSEVQGLWRRLNTLQHYKAAAVPTISGRYYADIRQTVPASDQEMNSLLAELSRNYSGDLGARVALHELYKYINKYYDQIITALEEDSTAQKMQLGYRLQQVAAAVENKVTDL
ncbi:PREDICTED: plexin-B1, partial [Myotis brandtii]|uniref:plexin-B1 n=1 Tax=Myotis brandtii TaxID=109478 RepID=UPI0007041BCC